MKTTDSSYVDEEPDEHTTQLAHSASEYVTQFLTAPWCLCIGTFVLVEISCTAHGDHQDHLSKSATEAKLEKQRLILNLFGC